MELFIIATIIRSALWVYLALILFRWFVKAI